MQEFWTLVDADGCIVLPVDCNPGHEDQGMLVYRSYEAALSAAKHQENSYDLEGVEPRRLDHLDVRLADEKEGGK